VSLNLNIEAIVCLWSIVAVCASHAVAGCRHGHAVLSLALGKPAARRPLQARECVVSVYGVPCVCLEAVTSCCENKQTSRWSSMSQTKSPQAGKIGIDLVFVPAAMPCLLRPSDACLTSPSSAIFARSGSSGDCLETQFRGVSVD
jgi:hypothetical protein